MHHLERNIVLATDPATLWSYIATPLNLNELTPPDMNFSILSEVPSTMYEGLQIRYEIVLPLLGRQKWLTEIREIVDGVSFVDVQLQGPYKSWYHRHIIGQAAGGSFMRDQLDYELPYGVAGAVTHELWVKGQLERIFAYRAQKLAERFGKVPGG